jgi:hypothetical protein
MQRSAQSHAGNISAHKPWQRNPREPHAQRLVDDTHHYLFRFCCIAAQAKQTEKKRNRDETTGAPLAGTIEPMFNSRRTTTDHIGH